MTRLFHFWGPHFPSSRTLQDRMFMPINMAGRIIPLPRSTFPTASSCGRVMVDPKMTMFLSPEPVTTVRRWRRELQNKNKVADRLALRWRLPWTISVTQWIMVVFRSGKEADWMWPPPVAGASEEGRLWVQDGGGPLEAGWENLQAGMQPYGYWIHWGLPSTCITELDKFVLL